MIERCGGRGLGYLLAFGLGMFVAKAMKHRRYRAVWRWGGPEGAEGFHHGPWCHGPWCESHYRGSGAPPQPPSAGGQTPPAGGGQPPEGQGS